MFDESTAFERHFSVGHLAKLWAIKRRAITTIIKNDPGVLRVRGKKRKHITYSIPESTARRIHARLISGT